MLASPFIARGFFPDPDSAVYKMARQLFVIYFLSLPLVFLNIVFANHFQAFGFSVISNIVSVVDGFLSVVIPALILTPVLGAFGAWLSFPIGLVLTTLCLVVLVIIRLRRKPAGLSDWLLLPEEFGNSERLILGIHDMEDVTETAAQVQAFCMEHGIGDRISMFAGLCLEEMAGNIVSHGFESNRKLNLVEVRVVIRPDEVVLRIKDGCVPFNPKEWYEMTGTSDPTSNIGIRLVFALAKEVIYQNLLGLNVLTIKLNV